MRRVLVISALLLLAFVPAYPQRGSRGGGGGFHGGGGYHASGAVASRGAPASVYHSAGGYNSRSQVPIRNWGNFGYGAGFGSGYGRPLHRPYRYGYGYYPYASYVYPYYAYPFYGLGFYGDYSSNNSNDEAYYAQQQALNAEIGSLNQQMDDLRNENDSLRDYIAERNAPPAPPEPSAPAAQAEPSQKPAAPPTILVYKDGRTIEAPNYAIVGNTIWVLTGQRATKIPLSDIDMAKTQQENEKRGVEFVDPTAK